MKIAVITDDGKTISQHFGRAQFFKVFTILEGKFSENELRKKAGHDQFHREGGGEHLHGREHGDHAGSHTKHVSMAETISDCQVLICGGMGRGAFESMRQLNLQPVVTDVIDIESALEAYLNGKLPNLIEKLH